MASYTGVSTAVGEDDRVRDYASWHRGTGYGPSTALDVADLLGDEAALRTRLRMFGSFASVAPTIRLATSGVEPVRLLLSGVYWPVSRAEPYMLRLLDPAAAFGLRRWPPLDAEVTFGLADALFPDLDGGWRLTVRDGRAACERTDAEPDPRFTDRGLALSYAGAQGCANLRTAGLLSGDDRHDGVWDALLGGRQFHVRDYFWDRSTSPGPGASSNQGQRFDRLRSRSMDIQEPDPYAVQAVRQLPLPAPDCRSSANKVARAGY